ncbi:aldose 1-epimerase [Biomphalaria glabrata]|nr:aldose 1-epimerase [Biomphalaria glabrata]
MSTSQSGLSSSVTKLTTDDFGVTSDGKKVTRYTLTNSSGANIKIINLGAAITEINVPDKDGKLGDVTLGFDTLKEYEDNACYMGALNGRFANRIAGGQFTLDGRTIKLCINHQTNSLHGGKIGFDKKLWDGTEQNGSLVLRYVSPDGEENYPGELSVTVTYSFDDDNTMTIDYKATTTKPTPVNLSNHAFYNLAGHGAGHIRDHIVMIKATHYLPVDEVYIPTGEIRPVAGTDYDLTSPVCLGDRLDKVRGGQGFDTNFCLDNNGKHEMVMRVDHPPSGRYLEVSTDEPGITFYTSNVMADMKGKGGATYCRFCAFVIEANHHPDSVNKPHFPSTILRPGQVYTQTTSYKFGLL